MKSEPYVITIGREYGSGGYEIGKRIAGSLGISFYDKELLTLAAKKSGLSPELFASADEKAAGKLSYALSAGFPFFGSLFSGGVTSDALFTIQSETILELARKESFVIVGRCADYVLRNHPCCFNAFIHSPLSFRIERVMTRKPQSRQNVMDEIAKVDKERANFYNFYSQKEWGRALSYHLCIDSSLFGIDRTAQIVEGFAMEKLKR